MKRILIASLLLVSSTAFAMPRIARHDLVLANYFVDTIIYMEDLQCGVDKNWDEIIKTSYKMHKYAEFRKDSQRDNTAAVYENLSAARSSPNCQQNLITVKEKLDRIQKYWGGR